MKRMLMTGIVTTLVLSAPPVHAQVGFGVGGGPSLPLGNLGDAVHSGIHVRAVVDLGLPIFPLSLRGDVMFQRLPGAGDLPSFQQLSTTLNGKFAILPLPLFSVHLTGGAGLYSSSYDPGDAPAERTTQPGINVGLGARISLLVIRPFVEARYHHVFTDPSRGFVPVTVGLFF